MAEVSAKSFLGLLQKSGLCEQAELKATISELFKKVKGGSVKLDQITNHLLEEGLVSEWHVKKLLSGKYKGFFLGKYKLLRHLGTGGMSTVYLAQHTIFNQQRAVKVLPRDRVADKTYLARFYREGRAAAALNHRNIVRVYDIDNEGDTHYLVMEYVKGEDIYEMVKRDGPLSCEQAIDYTIQSLTGLQHAHENDLVHRDIKPANLLVTPDGDVKILDLGLALFQEEDTSLTVMHNERVLGTADYLSPEQAVDSHNVDLRSDIYSAGCTLYFMLTGKPPFPDGTIAQRIAKHQSCEPKDIQEFRQDCPPELLAVVHKMMRKKASERYVNCDQLAAELRSIADGLLLGTPSIKVDVEDQLDKESKKVTAPVSVQTENRERKTNKPTELDTNSGAASPESTKKKNATLVAVSDKASKKQVTQTKPKQVEPSSDPTRKRGPKASATASTKQAIKQVNKQDARPRTSKQVEAVARETTEKSTSGTHSNSRGVQPESKKIDAKKIHTAKTEKEKPPGDSETPVKNRPKSKSKSKSKSESSKSKRNESAPAKSRAKPVPIDTGSKPHIEATGVSVIVSDQPQDETAVGVNEFRSFVAQNRSTKRVSAKPKRDSSKDQLMIAGLVIGMLLLLAIVLVIAKAFVTTKKEETSMLAAQQPVEVVRMVESERLDSAFEIAIDYGYDGSDTVFRG